MKGSGGNRDRALENLRAAHAARGYKDPREKVVKARPEPVITPATQPIESQVSPATRPAFTEWTDRRRVSVVVEPPTWFDGKPQPRMVTPVGNQLRPMNDHGGLMSGPTNDAPMKCEARPGGKPCSADATKLVHISTGHRSVPAAACSNCAQRAVSKGDEEGTFVNAHELTPRLLRYMKLRRMAEVHDMKSGIEKTDALRSKDGTAPTGREKEGDPNPGPINRGLGDPRNSDRGKVYLQQRMEERAKLMGVPEESLKQQALTEAVADLRAATKQGDVDSTGAQRLPEGTGGTDPVGEPRAYKFPKKSKFPKQPAKSKVVRTVTNRSDQGSHTAFRNLRLVEESAPKEPRPEKPKKAPKPRKLSEREALIERLKVGRKNPKPEDV